MPQVEKQELYDAVSAKDHKKLKELLSNATLDVINRKIEYLRESVLELAAGLGDEISVELLLTHGAVPNYKRPRPLYIWPNTTLSWAIKGGNLKIIQLLFKHGCDPDTTFEYDNEERILHTSPYNYWYKVIELNNLAIFQVLLECKNRKIVNDEWSQNMLLTACGLGSRSIVEYLLDQGMPVDFYNCFDKTPLRYAVKSLNISVVQLLIARGANIKHKDKENRNYLHIIARTRNQGNEQEIIQLLVDQGVEINAKDKFGLTPIAVAFQAVNDNLILQLLRQPGIDLTIAGSFFWHDIVAKCNQNTLKQVLCRPDVIIPALNIFNTTIANLIHYSSSNNLSLLLEFGANTENWRPEDTRIFKNHRFLKILAQFQLKRSVADLGEDLNISSILVQRNVLTTEERAKLVSAYSSEIQRMKETRLCGRVTYYHFLHANRRIYNIVTRKPGLREIFIEYKHDFNHYANMLAKNCVHNVKALTPIDIEAMNSVEDNLDMIFNNQLPSLVIDIIKDYIDIEDMVALQAVKLFCQSNNQTEKNVKKRKMNFE